MLEFILCKGKEVEECWVVRENKEIWFSKSKEELKK